MFLVSADVVMGLALGLFVYGGVTRVWTTLQNPIVASVIFAAAVLVVLFRRPNGSLARRGGGSRS